MTEHDAAVIARVLSEAQQRTVLSAKYIGGSMVLPFNAHAGTTSALSRAGLVEFRHRHCLTPKGRAVRAELEKQDG